MKYWKKAGYFLATALFLIFTVGPFVWTFIISITPDFAMFAPTSDLIPDSITFANYTELFSGTRRGKTFFLSMSNSLKAVAITLCIGIPIAIVSAYVLSRMEFKGKNVIRNLLLGTMVIPVMATISVTPTPLRNRGPYCSSRKRTQPKKVEGSCMGMITLL